VTQPLHPEPLLDYEWEDIFRVLHLHPSSAAERDACKQVVTYLISIVDMSRANRIRASMTSTASVQSASRPRKEG